MPVVPSPYLNADVLESPKTDAPSCSKCHYPGVLRGTLTAAARRGKALFEGRAGCAVCHPHPYFTSLQTVDGGLGTGVAYDVPSLVGAWRTAPYLHHGDALSLEETITDYNQLQMRGNTADLSATERADLLEYLRSL
jgi:cytochrome c peroxidase